MRSDVSGGNALWTTVMPALGRCSRALPGSLPAVSGVEGTLPCSECPSLFVNQNLIGCVSVCVSDSAFGDPGSIC